VILFYSCVAEHFSFFLLRNQHKLLPVLKKKAVTTPEVCCLQNYQILFCYTLYTVFLTV